MKVDGVDDVVSLAITKIRRDVHKEWYYGMHAIDDISEVQAVLLEGPERQPD